jgi:hypothetical protein
LLSGADFGYEVIRRYHNYELVRCPYHQDNSPSALFYPYQMTAKFRCLGCGKVVDHSGGLNYAGIEEISDSFLARYSLIRDSNNYLEKLSEDPSVEAYNWLVGVRNIYAGTAEHYGCRYRYESDRVLMCFPQIDNKDECVGVVNRLIRADYTGHVRYFIEGDRVPAWPLRFFDLSKRWIFVSEGAFKAMAIYEAAKVVLSEEDFRRFASVSTFGSVWTSEMADIYSQNPDSVVFVGDDDESGRKFAKNFKEIGCRAFIISEPFDNQTREKREKSLTKILERVNHAKPFNRISTSLGA